MPRSRSSNNRVSICREIQKQLSEGTLGDLSAEAPQVLLEELADREAERRVVVQARPSQKNRKLLGHPLQFRISFNQGWRRLCWLTENQRTQLNGVYRCLPEIMVVADHVGVCGLTRDLSRSNYPGVQLIQ